MSQISKFKLPSTLVSVRLSEGPYFHYPVTGTSADPLPEILPDIEHGSAYLSLTKHVRAEIKRVADRLGREVKYSVSVSVMDHDPTRTPAERGNFLVALISFE